MTAGKMEDWRPDGAILIRPWVIEAILFVATKTKLFSCIVLDFALIIVSKLNLINLQSMVSEICCVCSAVT